MYYYHMTSLNNLCSIAKQGLIPKNGNNGKLIGEDKTKVFFSEGFEGAIALFVDFDIVYNKIKNEQIDVSDAFIETHIMNTESLCDYLGEGVYLRFDGTEIINERNFENGCTDMIIPPEKLFVCILQNNKNNSVIFSRFEIIKYMMSKIQPEQIQYYGAGYKNSPSFSVATKRIQDKVKIYYNTHKAEISKYLYSDHVLNFITLKNFLENISIYTD